MQKIVNERLSEGHLTISFAPDFPWKTVVISSVANKSALSHFFKTLVRVIGDMRGADQNRTPPIGDSPTTVGVTPSRPKGECSDKYGFSSLELAPSSRKRSSSSPSPSSKSARRKKLSLCRAKMPLQLVAQ